MLIQEQVKQQASEDRPVRLMFEDEARFGRINEPQRCWVPAGVRPEVCAQMVREYEYAFAAVSPHDGVLDTRVLPEVNTEAMGWFLAEVSHRHRDELIVMVLDGAGWHKAKHLPVPANVRLIPLPPWSPQLNPTEHVWDEVREKWFVNRLFPTMDALQTQLVSALAVLENDTSRVASLCGFEWIKSVSLKAH
jgi:putative transposase